ncbi:hypothetical protein LAUMK4_02899 [Mycobacterium persicum]|uniref:Uncharacterized protein n=2 Tax=Mycobacterium persicum TaxID=1487726 RepID=A0ABY6RJB0_9MYCO|nr:hypothetical protein B1T44_01640 [Mycobacterium persicum]VAZ76249.1 hypothetical protein LAUMK15_03225 [Mycobacterium persicum]VAZ94738.1 hypothetical protein LAUMK4_02899 [Mycobacterium persicum]
MSQPPPCIAESRRDLGAAESELATASAPRACLLRWRVAGAVLGAVALTSGIAASIDATDKNIELSSAQRAITLTAHDGFKLGTGDGDDQSNDINNYPDYSALSDQAANSHAYPADPSVLLPALDRYIDPTDPYGASQRFDYATDNIYFTIYPYEEGIPEQYYYWHLSNDAQFERNENEVKAYQNNALLLDNDNNPPIEASQPSNIDNYGDARIPARIFENPHIDYDEIIHTDESSGDD